MNIDIAATAKKICQLVFSLIMSVANIVSTAQGNGMKYDDDDFALIFD